MNYKVLKVLAGNTNLYVDVLEKFNEGVVQSCRRVLTKSNLEEEMVDLQVKPFFSKFYAVTVYVRGMDFREIKQVISLTELEHVKIAIICGNVSEYDKFVDVVGVSLNCYRISNNILNHFITSRLQTPLTEEMLKEFRVRMKGRYDLIEYYIDMVNTEKPRNVKQLRKIVPKHNIIGFEKLFMNMLNKRDVKKSFSLIDNYTFGLVFLHKQFLKMIDKLDQLYKEFYEGRLNTTTVKEWCSNNSKEWKISEYYVEQYVKIMEQISYDEFMIVRERFETVELDRYSLYILYYSMFNRDRIGGL